MTTPRPFFVAALALASLSCQLGDLVKPGSPGKLVVSPASLLDSAMAGTSTARMQTLSLTSDGGGRLTWNASLAHGSAWIALAKGQDTVPVSVSVALRPNALAVGMYRDTIEITAGDGEPLRVPVAFSIRAAAAGQNPSSPTQLAQLNGDGTTAIPVGGAAAQADVVFRAMVTDPDGSDRIRVEVEVKQVGAAFTGQGAAQGGLVTNGSLASVTVSDVPQGTFNHWRARAIDEGGRASAWVSFGDNPEEQADFRAGPQRAPELPDVLGQYGIDGTTAITLGGLTTERTVILRGVLRDPDAGDSLRMEAEIQSLGIPFSNVPNAVSAQVLAGASGNAAATGLSDYTSYHWQARTVDRTGLRSAWVSFGGNTESEADLRVVLPPTRLAFLTEPSHTASAAPITPAVRVAVQDAGGSTLSYFNGSITVALSSNPSGGILTGTATVNAVNGIATFTDLRVDKMGSGYALAASSSGLPGVTSSAFNIIAGSASSLAFTTQPSTTAAGASITPSIRVAALDAQGNPATGFAGTVTLALGANPGGGTIAGTTTVTASGGVAVFADIRIDRAGTGYTLVATSSSLSAATSSPFSITAGGVSPSQSSVGVVPVTIPASSGASTATITVTASDAGGNRVSGATVALVATGTGNVVTPASGATSASGTFTATISSTVAGTKTISATVNGVAITQTATVTVTPAAASQLAFAVQPSSVGAGASIAPAIQVAAQDAFGNVVTTFTGSITMAIGTNPGAGTLAGTATVTAAIGVATFSNLSINSAGTGYTLAASSAGLAAATSTTFNVTAGGVSGAQSTVAAAPASIVASTGSAISTVTVTVRDGSGTPLAGVSVTLAATGTGNTFTPGTGTTNASGVFTSAFSSTIAGPKTISATAGGIVVTQTAGVTVTAAAATALVFTAQPTATAANAAITPGVTVTARDSFGNDATSFTGTVTVAIGTNPGTGVLTGTLSVAAATGVATFNNLQITPAGVGYTLATAATGVSGATSSAFNVTP